VIAFRGGTASIGAIIAELELGATRGARSDCGAGFPACVIAFRGGTASIGAIIAELELGATRGARSDCGAGFQPA
jgi:hypothetical protein